MPLALDGLDLDAFPAATEARWQEAVAKVLKGQPFETLRTRTADGLIEPIYARAADATPIAAARGVAPWDVVQRVDHPDAAVANALLLADLEGGTTGLDLVFATSPHARGFGLPSGVDLPRILEGVLTDLVSIRVSAGPATLARMADLVRASGQSPDRLRLTLAHDPIAEALRAGGSDRPLGDGLAEVARELASLAATYRGALLTVDGRIWHEAGASRTQTLAAVLASAVAFWRALEAAGLSISDAADRIGFTLAIDQNQFGGIAEIRALRLLWARATQAAGLAPQRARIHGETSLRMMSRLDANTNMIRTTVAAFAAGIGGVDSFSVLPHSAANGLPDAFARRVARNTQLILQEESNLHRVIDPGAGSGRIEAETSQLAEAAWHLFQSIEASGGIIANIEAGRLQADIAATAAERWKAVARRREPITGASEFPLSNEPAAAVFALQPAARPVVTPARPVPGLVSQRLAEPFEALRASAAATTPKVFLATLGSIADFGARATWIRNLFEACGIAAVTNDGFASLDELVAAFKGSGMRGVCLVGSDAIYADQALAALAALKSAGAGPVFFAGRPAAPLDDATLKAAGVDVFLFAGLDVVAALQDAHQRLAS